MKPVSKVLPPAERSEAGRRSPVGELAIRVAGPRGAEKCEAARRSPVGELAIRVAGPRGAAMASFLLPLLLLGPPRPGLVALVLLGLFLLPTDRGRPVAPGDR